MRRFLFVLSLLLALHSFNKVQAQEIRIDSARLSTEHIALAPIIKTKDPRKASLYSAILPGLGQAYNGKFWKIPILYAGIGGLIYAIDWNNNSYLEYREQLFALIDDNPLTEVTPEYAIYSETALRRGIETRRRDRDYLIIVTSVVYLLNIVDAHIDAHLYDFSISENLTLELRPSIGNIAYNHTNWGLSLKLKFN